MLDNDDGNASSDFPQNDYFNEVTVQLEYFNR